MELTFPWAPVKALANLASEQDLRKWCIGVWLDSSGPNLVVVATNGTVLGAYLTEEPSTGAPPVFLPLHIVKAARDFGPQATVCIDATGHAHVESFGTRHYWQDEKHVFIDYRRVIPRQPCTDRVQQINVEQLAKFLKVRKALGHKPVVSAVRVTHNAGAAGPDGALVTLAEEPRFVGVAMALREKEDQRLAPLQAPAWVFERGAAAPAPAAEETCDLV